jgi:acetolactate synthase-1/2/3 large subunit
MAETVSSVLLRILKKHGIRHVFGLPAAQIAMVMDGAGRDPWFKYLTVRHEEACGHMGHAIAKLTDSMAMCFATVGPGATNMVPGVAAAWADNVPLLVVTPNNQADSINPPRDLLQNADHIGLYKSITKWSAQIHHPQRAPELIERALHIARCGRPGPVHLDIPCDVASAACSHDLASIPNIGRQRPVPAADDIERLAELIASARRPLIIAGGGVVRSEATQALRTLLEATRIPATATPNARGVIPRLSPCHIGSGGVLAGTSMTLACSEADLIVGIGCKFSSFVPVNKPPAHPVPAGQRIVQIDIDGESLGRNVPLALGLVGDARETLRLLALALAGRKLALHSDWLPRLRAERAAYLARVDALADARTTAGTNRLNEAAFARAIARLLPADAIVCHDGGQVMEWTQTFIDPDDPHDNLFVPGMGHLGFGLPMANAAKLVHPDRTVVCINGDGAMGMTSQELETAARYGLNVIVICGNDSHWGMYRPLGEQIFQNPRFGTRLTDVKFARIAEGYGCHGEAIASIEELPAAFARAQQAGRPALIDVPVDYTPHPMDDFWMKVVLRGVNIAPCAVD